MLLCVLEEGIQNVNLLNFALDLAQLIDFSEYLSRNQLPAKKENDNMLTTKWDPWEKEGSPQKLTATLRVYLLILCDLSKCSFLFEHAGLFTRKALTQEV